MRTTLARPNLHFSSFGIKLIALVFMTLDHFGAYQTFTTNGALNGFLRVIGRIAAPLFLFIVVESLRHTRSKVKFVLRLYAAGVIVEIFNRIFETIFQFQDIGNILPTFFYVALLVTALESLIAHRNRGSVALSIACFVMTGLVVPLNILLCESGHAEIWAILSIFLPSIFTVEYSVFFVLLGIAWYFVNDRRLNCVLLALLSCLSFAIPDEVFFAAPRWLQPLYFNGYGLFSDPQGWMCLAIPFMLLYDGTKGKGMKYFFYIYYPAHVYLLAILSYLRYSSV